MKRSFEQSEYPESRERGRPYVEMQDISAFSEFSLEKLSERSVEIILEKVKKGQISEDYYRRKYNLPNNQPFVEELQRFAEETIECYRKNVTEKTQSFKRQADDCFTVAKQRGYLTEARDYRIIITDNLLHHGLEHSEDTPAINTFSQSLNAVYVEYTQPNKLVAHEVGHALSLRPNEGRSGFATSEAEYKSTGRKGNKWFNEGVTVMWEDISVNDGSIIPSREAQHDYYGWSRDATRVIIDELKLDDDTVFKAYFGDRAARELIEKKVNERFKCSLDDLQCLTLKTDIDFTRRVIYGEKVELTIKDTTHDSVIKMMNKLSEIFPNVSIVDTRENRSESKK